MVIKQWWYLIIIVWTVFANSTCKSWTYMGSSHVSLGLTCELCQWDSGLWLFACKSGTVFANSACKSGSDTIWASQIHDGKWLAEGGFSVTNLENLDRIRHDQGWLTEGVFSVTNLKYFYISTIKLVGYIETDDRRVTITKFWKTLVLSEPVQISQIRDGKSTLSWPFSVTNLGSPDRVWSCPALIVFDLDQSVWIRDEG